MIQSIGKARRVMIYVGESDKWGHKALHMAILETLKAEDCAGATVTRALAGFGAHSGIKTASLVALSADLPLVIEWVDNPARVERVLPHLRDMVREGLITVEDVDVVFYSHRGLRHLSAFVPVQDVMSRRLNTTRPETPIADLVERLFLRVEKALPVVDSGGKLVGIVTDGDLLRKTGSLSPSICEHLTQAEFEAEIDRLRQAALCVRDIMSPDPITVAPDATIHRAVELMLKRDIKRLPVVNEEGELVGIVSRVDVLRAFAQPLTAEQPRQTLLPGQRATVAEVMTRDAPWVDCDASLAEVVGQLVSHRQRRVVVIDAQGQVAGIISDGDLLKRAQSTERSDIIRSLSRGVLPAQAEEYGLAQRKASQVMTAPVISVKPDTPLTEALQLLLEYHIKRLPVVDDGGQLLGLVGRAGILQALMQSGA